MILEHLNIQEFVRRFLSLCVVLAMLVPTVLHAVVIVTESEYTYDLMVLDNQEESEKEEKQENDTKNEKIEMQILSSDEHDFLCAAKHAISKPLDAASDHILEIPFPPPERK